MLSKIICSKVVLGQKGQLTAVCVSIVPLRLTADSANVDASLEWDMDQCRPLDSDIQQARLGLRYFSIY